MVDTMSPMIEVIFIVIARSLNIGRSVVTFWEFVNVQESGQKVGQSSLLIRRS
jgi:hypothetical protein